MTGGEPATPVEMGSDVRGPVVMVGFMAAGKSTVGRCLASRLGFEFVDLDSEIERIQGVSIAEIFAREGEAGFRRLEADVTLALRPTRRTVVATGGGWMAQDVGSNWTDGVRVWLQVSLEQAWARLDREAGTRPLLGGHDPYQAARSLLEIRSTHYRGAEIHVDTNERDPQDIADEIVDRLNRLRE